MRVSWLLGAFVISSVLAALQWWAVTDFLYWHYEWFDIPMHLLGGLSIGVLLVGFLYRHRPLLFVVLLALAIIGWEIFEYYFGIPREANYAGDTVQDLILGTLGGSIAYLIARLTLWHSK